MQNTTKSRQKTMNDFQNVFLCLPTYFIVLDYLAEGRPPSVGGQPRFRWHKFLCKLTCTCIWKHSASAFWRLKYGGLWCPLSAFKLFKPKDVFNEVQPLWNNCKYWVTFFKFDLESQGQGHWRLTFDGLLIPETSLQIRGHNYNINIIIYINLYSPLRVANN